MLRIGRIDWARLADFTLAFGLLVASLVEVWIVPFSNDYVNGSHWLNTVFLAGASLPLLWRRTRPEAAFLVFAVSWSTYLLLLYPRQIGAPGATWFMMLVAWFSFGLYGHRRRAAVAGSVGALGFLAVMARMLAADVTPSEVLPNWIFPLGAWLLGRLLQRRDLLAKKLRHRAADLETRQAEEAARAVALERTRIARELHDVISHSVSVIVMQAAVERRLLADEHPRYRETLLAIERAGRDALSELRTLLGVLSEHGEADLAPQPGLDQLETLVERVRAAGLPVELHVDGELSVLPPGLELAAYRVVQEGLTNVVKHAGATQATVVVRVGSDDLVIEVVDDGQGPNGSGSGRGLVGLRERIQLHGGRLETLAPEAGGFTLRSRIPVPGGSR